MDNKKMFVVSGGFLPYNDTVTLLTYKRLKHLDLTFNVAALKAKKDLNLEQELQNDSDYKKFNISYYKDYDDVISINKPLNLINSLFNMQGYIKFCLKEFQKHPCKYLYSSSIPGISHICASVIKKKYKDVIWIASFSDPIYKSPYKNLSLYPKTSLIYKLMFKIGSFIYMNNKYEKVAFKHADKLVFICKHQKDFQISNYINKDELEKKSIIMPLTYIKGWKIYDELIDIKCKQYKPKVFVHMGRIYGLRKIDEFIKALIELKKEIIDIEKKIVFHQYLEVPKYILKIIKENNLEKLFIVHDKVDYKTSLNIMKRSSGLLLFDTLMEDKIQPYLPSKILEYLLLKKDILAICKPNSPTYEILNTYGHYFNSYKSKDIKHDILDLIENSYSHNYSLDKLDSKNYDLLNMIK